MGDPQKEIELLRTTIEVLEQENSQLSERAEDAMLLGLVAEAIQGIKDPQEVIFHVLERISILKDFPFVTCCKMTNDSLERVCSYSLFTDNESIGYPIVLQPEIYEELQNGPFIDYKLANVYATFSPSTFIPSSAILIPFQCRDFGPSLFLLFNRDNSDPPQASELFLLDQIVNLAASYLDNLFLSKELDSVNASLEDKIQQKTADLTDANQKLLESHNQFSAVLDGIDAYVYVVNLETYEILYANQKYKQIIESNFKEKPCYNTLKNRSYPCEDCNIANLLEHISIPDYVVVTESWEPGLSKWLLSREKIVSWPGVDLAKLTIDTDISDIKKAEDDREKMQQSLQQAQKMEAVGILAGSVAHDLNNILSGIVSYPDLLLNNISHDDPMQKPLETIKTAGEKAAAIVRDLLTLARRGLKDDTPVDFAALVKDYIDSAECQTLLRNHDKITIVEPDNYNSLVIKGSAVHLANILMNLVTNAAEAMVHGGTIQIELEVLTHSSQPVGFKAWRPGKYVQLTVKDTGPGIPHALQERIFEPFYSNKELNRSGTGLGLAIVWGTVMDHAGLVTIDSKEGQGTSFHVLLPLLDDQKKVEQKTKLQEPIRGAGQSVLVVDDVENQRQIASDILIHLGYTVTTVKNGEEAIAYLTKNPANVVLLDMIMSPGIDGLETYKRIIGFIPNQRVIIVSGYSKSDRIEEAKNLGIAQFVAKPYSIINISDAIDKALREQS